MPRYSVGRMICSSESRLAVVYKRRSTADDGTPGAPQWWNHETGAWDSAFVAASHRRPLDVHDDGDHPFEQSFVPPVTVTDDVSAYAVVLAVDAAGEPLATFEVVTGNYLYTATRAPMAKS